MKFKISFLLIMSLVLTACASTHKVTTAYQPAMNTTPASKNIKIRYVPVPMPGQLMPLKKVSKINKKAHKLVGVDAVRRANQKAKRMPNSSEYINSIMNFNYMQGALYQIYCAPLKITDIQFQKGENIISVAAGDTLRWQVSKTYSGSGFNTYQHLLIKPMEKYLTNTLVVTTNRRTYHLMLHSTANTYMASVKWRYPESYKNFGPSQRMVAGNNQTSLDTIPNINNLKFNYQIKLIKGVRPDWMPTMVFNADNKTYIKFPSNIQEAPTLFVGNSAKNDRIINYRVEGNYYIVDEIISQAQLRIGQKDQTVIQITRQ